MPLFHRQPAPDRERQDMIEAEQAASRESLENGGLPIRAQERLQSLAKDPDHLFTSDLSVSEFVLAAKEGLQPVTQVMGSAFYRIGWTGLYGGMASGEMDGVSNSYNTARSLAIRRLQQEAKLARAHAVIGVHVTTGVYEWASNMIEFTAIGTAVRLEGAPLPEVPSATNLSGQDFWKLYQAGHWPLGLVGGTCVWYQVASWATQSLNWFTGGWSNQEIQDFTYGMMTARHLASSHVTREASRLGASGVVGVSIEQEATEHEVEMANDTKRRDMIFTFQALGTAVAPIPGVHPHFDVEPVKPLND
jgi:uncharacterized protein YbjQ (UPF0145 family)